jgi:hypothetical protein
MFERKPGNVQRQKMKEKTKKQMKKKDDILGFGFTFVFYFRQRSHFGGFQSPEVREKKNKKKGVKIAIFMLLVSILKPKIHKKDN